MSFKIKIPSFIPAILTGGISTLVKKVQTNQEKKVTTAANDAASNQQRIDQQQIDSLQATIGSSNQAVQVAVGNANDQYNALQNEVNKGGSKNIIYLGAFGLVAFIIYLFTRKKRK